MKAVVAKKVSMLELFYDLLFVYAISKMTAMIHHPIGGVLPIHSYMEFVIVVIIVMQIWLYQTLYINRFGKSRLVDNIGLLISMYAMTYMANNINTEWSITFRSFNTAFLMIVVNLVWQYLCGSGPDSWKNRDTRSFVVTLILELICVAAGLIIGYHYGIILCVVAGLIGFLMPLVMYRQLVPDKVNFPHLVERLSLIIIISFGETLVNVTRYFTGNLFNPLPLVIFILLATMFGSYVLQSDQLINHHQRSRGFVLMYSHVFMIVAILSLTAGLDYLSMRSVSQMFLWSFLSICLIAYYLCVYVNGVYNHHAVMKSRDYVILAAMMLIGLLIALLGHHHDLGLLIGLALASVSQCGYLLKQTRVGHQK